jgi:hypothetical protein
MRVEAALGLGLILTSVGIGLSTTMPWETSTGLNGFEVMSQSWLQGNQLFAIHGGGDNTVDLIVGPGLMVIGAVLLAGLGLAITLLPRGSRRRAPVAAVSFATSIFLLGLALWDFDRIDKYVPGKGTGLIVWTTAAVVASGLAAALIGMEARRFPVGTTSRRRALARAWGAVLLVVGGASLAGPALLLIDLSSVATSTAFGGTLTILVGSVSIAATLAVFAISRPGAARAGRAILGVVCLAVCAVSYQVLTWIGQQG